MNFELNTALDIQQKLLHVSSKLDMPHVVLNNIYCFRSYGSTSRAIARIWSLPRIWQMALNVKPGYCLEVIAEKFDKMSEEEQIRTLIHELMHIPKTFSGALVPHKTRYGRINNKSVEKIFQKYLLLK